MNMIIGVPQEVKNNEFRVGLTPGNVRSLCKQGHSVLVQRGAGSQIGLTDEAYRMAGANLINSAAEVFKKAEMIKFYLLICTWHQTPIRLKHYSIQGQSASHMKLSLQ
jgi:alanine dehydrogenase